jgi:excisionase family DNA binding protein
MEESAMVKVSPLTATEPLLLTIAEACRIIGIRRSSLYREFSAGRIQAVKVGKRTLVPMSQLKDWLAKLRPAPFAKKSAL